MHPAELAILLHRALELRMARFQELLQGGPWLQEPEALHQVRVAARRLGAVLELVDPQAYGSHRTHRHTLKRLVSALGPCRELDVHATALQGHHQSAAVPLQAACLEHLLEGLDRARAKARRTLAREVEALPLDELPRLLRVKSLPHPFQSISLQDAAWELLRDQGKVLGELPDLARQEDALALHKARVQLKKLRYALEALEAAFAPPLGDLPAFLRDLQANLGGHHDLATLESWLWEAEARLRSQGRAVLCGGVLELIGTVAEARRSAFEAFSQRVAQAPLAAFPNQLRAALGLSLFPGEPA